MQLLGEFQSRAVTQAGIQQDESRRPILDEIQRVGRVQGVSDNVAVLRQNPAEHLAQDGVVFHDQDGRRV